MESRTKSLTEVACVFLDGLEKALLTGEDLPVPFVMKRIKELLEQNQGPAFGMRSEFEAAMVKIVRLRTPIFVDVQSLVTTDGKNIVKEFTACSRGAPPAWASVKSPSEVQPDEPTNRYLKKSFHGISWDDGEMDFKDLRRILEDTLGGSPMNEIYHKGKSEVLQNLGIPFLAIAEVKNAPRLRDLRARFNDRAWACPFHKHLDPDFACSSKTAGALMESRSDEEW